MINISFSIPLHCFNCFKKSIDHFNYRTARISSISNDFKNNTTHIKMEVIDYTVMKYVYEKVEKVKKEKETHSLLQNPLLLKFLHSVVIIIIPFIVAMLIIFNSFLYKDLEVLLFLLPCIFYILVYYIIVRNKLKREKKDAKRIKSRN